MARKQLSNKEKVIHGANIFASALNLGVFSTVIYFLTHASLMPHFLALSPYFISTSLVVASIGWFFSAYELYYTNQKTLTTSRWMDFIFKTLLVLGSVAALVVSFTAAAISPIITMSIAALTLVYLATQTLYHISQAIVSDDMQEKKTHARAAVSNFLALGLGSCLIAFVALTKVAHVVMMVAAVLTSVVVGAAKLSFAIKKLQQQKQAVQEQEKQALEKELEQVRDELQHVQTEIAAAGSRLTQTVRTTATKPAPAPGLTQPTTEAPSAYTFPEIKTRDELLKGLDRGIAMAEQSFKSFGHVSTYHLQGAALKALKGMVESPQQGSVTFLENSYRWSNLSEMKQVMISLYEQAAKNHLFESKQGSHKKNSVQFLFDSAVYQKIDYSLIKAPSAIQEPHIKPTDHH